MNKFESPIINPCPYCGRMPIQKSFYSSLKKATFWHVKCEHCGATGPRNTDKAESLKLWNRMGAEDED